MALLDWIVIGIFCCALIGIVLWVVSQKNNNSADYFLGGKDATWIAIGASIFASNIGSEHLIGLAGAGASSGMAMAHWEIQGWMILILGWVFVPFYTRSMVYTMPEFLERRYNTQSRTILSVISLISYVLTVTVYAGGLVFQQVFGIKELWGIDFFWIAAIGLVLITALYTIFGGMKSVLYTSVLQTPILLLGSLIILVLGMRAIGSWDLMLQYCDVKPNYEGATGTMIHLMRSNSDPQYPWLGALIGSAVIGFWYWCTDQYIVQRVLSGKNERESRRGTIFGAYLKLLPVFLFLIPGMIAFALHQKSLETGATFLPLLEDGMPNADAAFPTLVAKILPAGVKGLVVCGILAALMSSLASLFNSSAMLFTIDFWKRLKPQTSERNLVRIGQMATVVIVILGILWIPIMRSVGNVLYNYLQDVQSVLAPGIAAAFLLGICWKRASAKGGMWGLLSGIIIGLTRLGAKVYSSNTPDAADSWFKYVFYDFNWLFFCGVMLVVCCLVVIVVSLCTEAPDKEKIQGLVFGTSTPEQIAATRQSWNHWDVIHTIIILGITVAFYIYFW